MGQLSGGMPGSCFVEQRTKPFPLQAGHFLPPSFSCSAGVSGQQIGPVVLIIDFACAVTFRASYGTGITTANRAAARMRLIVVAVFHRAWNFAFAFAHGAFSFCHRVVLSLMKLRHQVCRGSDFAANETQAID